MKKNKSIASETEKYVRGIFAESLPDWAVYHNLDHTIETVKGCKIIGAGSDCSKSDIEILLIAAWFHDVGYLIEPENHERISGEIADEFLVEKEYPEDRKEEVYKCILATKLGAKPRSLLESILCDADLISLGQKKYYKLNNVLKLEIELRDQKEIDDQAWLKRSYKFLVSHNFYTNFAKNKFDDQLNKNLELLKEKLEVK